MAHGGKRAGTGRPPSDTAYNATAPVKCHQHQKDLWAMAAEEHGVSIAETVRDLMDAWAHRVLASEDQ